MGVAEAYGDRLSANFEGMIIAAMGCVFAAIGEVISSTAAEVDADLGTALTLRGIIFTIQNYPTLLTLIGFGVIVLAAGIPGFFGFLMEIAGVSMLLGGNAGGIWLILFGAGLIVVGTHFWSWSGFFKLVLDSSGGSRI